jgi:hypothetical protein
MGRLPGAPGGRGWASAIDTDLLREVLDWGHSSVALSTRRRSSSQTTACSFLWRRSGSKLNQTARRPMSEPAYPVCARKQPWRRVPWDGRV